METYFVPKEGYIILLLPPGKLENLALLFPNLILIFRALKLSDGARG